MAAESYNLSNELLEMGTLFLKYNQGEITEEEKADLKAFLLTLTDHELLTDPAYGPPRAIEEWVPH